MSSKAQRALKRIRYCLYPLLRSVPGPDRFRKAFESLRHTGTLNRMSTMDQFREYVTHARPQPCSIGFEPSTPIMNDRINHGLYYFGLSASLCRREVFTDAPNKKSPSLGIDQE